MYEKLDDLFLFVKWRHILKLARGNNWVDTHENTNALRCSMEEKRSRENNSPFAWDPFLFNIVYCSRFTPEVAYGIDDFLGFISEFKIKQINEHANYIIMSSELVIKRRYSYS